MSENGYRCDRSTALCIMFFFVVTIAWVMEILYCSDTWFLHIFVLAFCLLHLYLAIILFVCFFFSMLLQIWLFACLVSVWITVCNAVAGAWFGVQQIKAWSLVLMFPFLKQIFLFLGLLWSTISFFFFNSTCKNPTTWWFIFFWWTKKILYLYAIEDRFKLLLYSFVWCLWNVKKRI